MSNDLVKNPFAGLDDRQDESVPTATLQIYQHIAEKLARQGVDTNVNRGSAASLCYKRRWYQAQGFKGEDLSPRKIINFALGDLTEHMVKFFISQACVGPGKLYSEVYFGEPNGKFSIQNGYEITIFKQETLSATLTHSITKDSLDVSVSCHADGWGKRNSDNQWELIEVKSAADYGFDSFKTDGPGDYLKQVHVLMQSCKAQQLGVKEVRFFYLKKNTGHVFDRLFQFDRAIQDEVYYDFIRANQSEEPEAPYTQVPELFRGKPTGRQIIPFPCSYCPYKEKCYKSFDIEIKNDKPKFVIKTSTEKGVSKCSLNTTLKPDQKQKVLDPLACF